MNIPIPTTTQDIFSYGFSKGLYRTSLYPETGIDSSNETFNLKSDVIVGGVIRTAGQGMRIELSANNANEIIFYSPDDYQTGFIQGGSSNDFPSLTLNTFATKEYVNDHGLEEWVTVTNLTYWTENGVSAGTRDIDKESTIVEIWGDYSAKLTNTGNDGTIFGFYQDVFSEADNRLMFVSCDVKITSKTAGKIVLNVWNETDSVSLGTNECSAVADWIELVLVFQMPTSKIIRIKVYSEDETTGVAYIDHFHVYQTNSSIDLQPDFIRLDAETIIIRGRHSQSRSFYFETNTPNVDKYEFYPRLSNAADLGTSTYQWKDLYIDGKAYIDEFGEFPLTPSSAPVNDYDIANKKFVEDSTYGTESFTTGENITAGNIVGFQNAYTDFEATHDAFVNSADANQNYGALAYLGIGSGDSFKGYLLFAPTGITTKQVLRAELRLYVNNVTGTPTITIYRNGAGFDEATITWNNKPVDVTTVYGVDTTQTVSGTGWQTFDITNLVKLWIGSDYANNGISIVTNATCQIKSKEATGDYAPRIRVYKVNSYETSGGKATVWKSDNTVIERCMKVIGVATETKSSGHTIKIQTDGVNNDITSPFPGQDIYLDTAGSILGDIGSLTGERIIKVGTGTDSNAVKIGIDTNNSFIDVLDGSATASQMLTYCPDNTKKVIVTVISGGTTMNAQGIHQIKMGPIKTYFARYTGAAISQWSISVTSANKVTTDVAGLSYKAYFYR